MVDQEAYGPPHKAGQVRTRKHDDRYCLFGTVNFVGAHPALSYFDSPGMSSPGSLPVYVDPLVVHPLEITPLRDLAQR